MNRIVIVGAGAWGGTLANLLAVKNEVILLARDPDGTVMAGRRIKGIDISLKDSVLTQLVTDPSDNFRCDLLIVAVHCDEVTEAITDLARFRPQLLEAPILIATKGIDRSSGEIMSTVVSRSMGKVKSIGVVGGPNLAPEVAREVPTTASVAFTDLHLAQHVSTLFPAKIFRCYPSRDIVGIQVWSALKNVLAIASGMAISIFGESYHYGPAASILMRGAREIQQLSLLLGGESDTAFTSAGFGDLYATSASSVSRNHTAGRLLGQGMSGREVLHHMKQEKLGFPEGIITSYGLTHSMARSKLEMPTFSGINKVISGDLSARQLLDIWLARDLVTESKLTDWYVS